MMDRRSALALPVALRREGGEAWGHLVSVTAGGARLVTLTELSRGEGLWASFELAGERFKDLAAVVDDARPDAEGYCAADLRWTDPVERRRLAKALLDALARG